MRRDQIRRIVQDCISNTHNCQYGPKDIKEEAHLKEDLGMDSLDYVELIMKLEKELNISVPDDDMQGKENSTVGEIIDYLKTRIA